jgi:hypothetical protein
MRCDPAVSLTLRARMSRGARWYWIIAVTALVASCLFAVFAPPSARAADRDCPDFPDQRSAQDFFESRGGPIVDPHRLNDDDDGLACDDLPCPCVRLQSFRLAPDAVRRAPPGWQVAKIGTRCKGRKRATALRSLKRGRRISYWSACFLNAVAAYDRPTRRMANVGKRTLHVWLRSTRDYAS